MKRKNLLIIGGDTRQLAVCDYFAEKGFDVKLWGIDIPFDDEKYTKTKDLNEAVLKSDILILPLPLSKDGIRLNMPLSDLEEIKLSYLFSLIDAGKTVYAGKISENIKDYCRDKKIKLTDYFENEILCIKNALLTAEAAADIVMRELPVSLDSSRIMVIGFGRVGKLLTNLLLKFNADVTVAARKTEDLAFAECIGAKGIKIEKNSEYNSLLEINNGYDVVFNTVPVCLIDKSLIEKLKENIIIIDLSSAPGGVDIRAAKERKIKIIWALSLPGKYSPARAGKIIAEAIYQDMEVCENEEA